MTLEEFFKKYPTVAIALSGGVDSTYLTAQAARYAQKVHAYTVRSAFQPEFEIEEAAAMAKRCGVSHTILKADILAVPEVAANPKNRCYYCKKMVFSTLSAEAARDGFSIILDGTNASDDVADRPGMKALKEMGVLSPLRLCGLTKAEIRKQSKALGLPTWNKPSYACLATRIPTGEQITQEKLSRTEWAETYLRNLGFRDFRVRLFNNCAKLQITAAQWPLAEAHREAILNTLRTRYDGVLLDLEVRP
ncbi:MAG: ATP-dependent sacrificial sulfur transferase LarE [Acidaminococcus sp.]|nr:ATP-dependent sacrificial sulfur transferase LarE [Acidaminococcus sp.]MCI2114208.1 ATP-dependent sacrificial sulfur transferase LarE [Acidaminococcus sp.]MCI2116143.1 ATP-dependent sacrificial sulfur transferase LarE [Acidaminococcus sp.]